MFRLISSISILLTLYICNPMVSASDANASADAFTMITSDLPPQADPATRKFLQSIAIQIKKDWHGISEPSGPRVLATFAKDADKTWTVRPFVIPDVSINYVRAQSEAVELVKKTLADAHPPNNQSMTVMFIFDTNQDNSPKIAGEKLTSHDDIDFGPYMASLQRKVRSNWSLEKNHQKIQSL